MENLFFPDRNTQEENYKKYEEIRYFVIQDLESRIEKIVNVLPSPPTIKIRSKNFDSYFKKYLRILKKDVNLSQAPHITDLIGLRIVCPFIEDLDTVEDLLKNNFEVFEVERKGAEYTFKEFGYESIHLLVKIPEDIITERGVCGCEVAEIQIRTILQDAWAEVEHELVYKAQFNPFGEGMKRKLAAVNASLSLADTIFQEVRVYQRQLNGELGKRRESFYKKIEESVDAHLFDDIWENTPKTAFPAPETFSSSDTIDNLLLNALYAHNKNQFPEAIAFYSRILELNPDRTVSALIYKHRGMAHFARSRYEDAIADFEKSLDLDPTSYKSAYYRGVVCSVQKQYIQAIEDFNRSLEMNPYQPYCLYRRGQAYFHLEDYPKALADCQSALAIENIDPALKFKELLLQKMKM